MMQFYSSTTTNRKVQIPAHFEPQHSSIFPLFSKRPFNNLHLTGIQKTADSQRLFMQKEFACPLINFYKQTKAIYWIGGN
jgi:hypothetical protein